MKTKLQLLTLFLLVTLSLNGQINHDIKLDLFGAIQNNYIPQYEVVLDKKISVQVGLGFDLSGESVIRPLDFTFEEFSSFYLKPSLEARYYLKYKNDNGRGLFIGPYVGLSFLIDREDGYVERWEEVTNRVAPDWLLSDSGIHGIAYGLNGGYKWVINSFLVLELKMTITVDRALGEGSASLNDNLFFEGNMNVNFGYRFGS